MEEEPEVDGTSPKTVMTLPSLFGEIILIRMLDRFMHLLIVKMSSPIFPISFLIFDTTLKCHDCDFFSEEYSIS